MTAPQRQAGCVWILTRTMGRRTEQLRRQAMEEPGSISRVIAAL